ncbi:DMT family transporter [Peribacillus kribbensis]|uniref:DMT family transporter n=1 Tax=Peribacillus kribbensis TaxID=356658 RepID=UPI0003FE807C|nr:DMT family transporter [Peribacillus kribbensis]
MNKAVNGWVNGFIGVLIFSGSLPATRLAVGDFDPLFLTVCRASIAGVLAGASLLVFRQQRPSRGDIVPLLVVAIGVVMGFPLLTALALQYVTSAHAIIFIGLLPLSTAIFGVLRGGERPRPAFWIFSAAGSFLVTGYALFQGGPSSPAGDTFMLFSIIVCGLGYAEGARLSRRLGDWQVISWALVLSLPAMLLLSLYLSPVTWKGIGHPALFSLGYVSIFSMLIGFVFWYRGLAQGGIAAVGQLQLLQPFFGLLLASVILHEKVSWLLVAVNIAVVFCVAAARRFSKKPEVPLNNEA